MMSAPVSAIQPFGESTKVIAIGLLDGSARCARQPAWTEEKKVAPMPCFGGDAMTRQVRLPSRVSVTCQTSLRMTSREERPLR